MPKRGTVYSLIGVSEENWLNEYARFSGYLQRKRNSTAQQRARAERLPEQCGLAWQLRCDLAYENGVAQRRYMLFVGMARQQTDGRP